MTRFGSLALLTCALVASCGPAQPSSSAPESQVVVSAAASLTDAFGAIKTAFETEHPGTEVVLNFGGSSSLQEQILQGAPVDVFAAAAVANMAPLIRAGWVAGTPHIFTRNRLQIAVPAGNPAGVTGLDDFARPSLLIGLCATGVPCGDFARLALSKAGVTPSIDTDEPDVRALLTKIESGELDAGITYVTDVASAGGKVDGITIPEAFNVTAEYPIAVLESAPHPANALLFVDFVLSSQGQLILAKYGFSSS
jgi:molybdate transport system substrate-binding protein